MNNGMLLRAIDLGRAYRRGSETIHALAGLSLELEPGRMVAVVGRSGSGKTTLLNQIGCLDKPTGGRLEIAGTDVTRLSESALVGFRRNHIGFIFQLFYLIPTLTVYENVELPMVFARRRDPRRVRDMLEQVGLAAQALSLPRHLSGGDMQRAAIARALVNQPKILLADEPTGRLEHKARSSILDLFRRLKGEGLSIIVATHDLDLARSTEKVYELVDGRVDREYETAGKESE